MIVLRLIRLSRRLRARRSLGFVVIACLMLVSIFGNAICFYLCDHRVNDELTMGDAIWYSIISVTTIGYGDLSAHTLGARVGTTIFIVLLGLSTFSVFLGMVIDGIGTVVTRGQKGLRRAMARNHVLIVNFPGESRVRQIIDEIRSDPQHQHDEIVVISDQIDELPFRTENVLFVRGSAHDAATYRRAMIEHARMAIVLSRDYADANSDAVAAAAASVINSINSDIHIVAECLNEAHRGLFKSVRCDAIVSGLRIAGNLLVQEIHDPGISRMIEVITSNQEGSTLYSAHVSSVAGTEYRTLAKNLLDHGINLLAVNREDNSLTDFSGIRPETDDRVIYTARERHEWSRLLSLGDQP